MTSWARDSRYKLLSADEDKPEAALHQYIITVSLAANDEFKFNLYGTSTWLVYSNFEEGGAKGDFENVYESNNIKVKNAGRYRFYVKEFNGYNTVYVIKLNNSVKLDGSLNIIKLTDNILTINGHNYKLIGTTTGSDIIENSYKSVEAYIDNEGYINLVIGNAVFKAEDYNSASNFELSDGSYLETSDGLWFCVAD